MAGNYEEYDEHREHLKIIYEEIFGRIRDDKENRPATKGVTAPGTTAAAVFPPNSNLPPPPPPQSQDLKSMSWKRNGN